jgi:UDP-N-acetylglucosamine 1-carboxyvinyltransferase
VKFVVNGGQKLEGKIRLAGAKNAATKMMVASLLTDEPCRLENCPAIGDIAITAELCQLLGAKIENESPNSLIIHTPQITETKVLSLSRRNRIPILALGTLLARRGEAQIPVAEGDKIGPRPVDLHFEALEAMGATITKDDHHYFAEAKNGLHGARIALRYPSVMATENIILAATLAKGRTVIEGAAVEPEIIDLIKMLQKMGAIIELGANRRIYIDGVKKLRGVSHRLLPDRNEAVSFAVLAVATGGDIFVEEAKQEHLITFLNALRKVGGEYEVAADGIRFWRSGKLKSIEIETDTHPGFMTDWQQPFTILLTQADGSSIVHETVYEDRFSYVEDLNLMGADIKLFTKCLGELPCRFNGKNHSHSALINGPTPLKAAEIRVRDLRAGMAHLVAALIAEGQSTILGVEEIDRGYEKIDERLKALGAEIQRVN